MAGWFEKSDLGENPLLKERVPSIGREWALFIGAFPGGYLEKMEWIVKKAKPDVAAVLAEREELEKMIQLYEIINRLEVLYKQQYEEGITQFTPECVLDRWKWREFSKIRKCVSTPVEVISLENQLKGYIEVFTYEALDKFVDIGWWDFVLDNLDIFKELLDDEMAKKLIKLWYAYKVFPNKDKFHRFVLDMRTAYFMLENKMIWELCNYISYFSDKDQLELIEEIIKRKWWEIIWSKFWELEVLKSNEMMVNRYLSQMLEKWVATCDVRKFRDNYYKNLEEKVGKLE